MLNTVTKLFAVGVLLTGSAGLFAQMAAKPGVQNVVQLAATGGVEVQQDWLSIAMSTTRDGSEASAVQNQLRMALDTALAEARQGAQPGLLELRTGNFSIYPRYGRDGKHSGWQGSAELILEGRDLARISATAGKIQALTVGRVTWGLSREQRARAEAQAQGLAIEDFKGRAMEIARHFGFAAYTLREISVSLHDPAWPPRPPRMTLEARASVADAPVPVEAGKTLVGATVSGTVQLE